MDEWTIVELAELAADALARPETAGPDGLAGSARPERSPDDGPARANGRVRDVPNERLIRWYGTVGLVDPPLSRRGRVARYGRRHLLQLVAVKRRQAEGRSLAEIQAELAGATDEVLAAVARVPDVGPSQARDGGQEPATGAGPGAPGSPARFWARQPRQPVAEAATAGAEQDVPTAGLVYGIRLTPGVTLLLDGADREPGPRDLTAIVNAARPLLRELANRGLGAASPHHSAETDHPQTGARNEH